MNYEAPTVCLLAQPGGGGVGRHVIDLYWALKKAEWKVKVFATRERLEPLYAEELRQIPGQDLTLTSMHRSISFSDANVVRELRDVLRATTHPRLLHAHSTKAGLLGMALKRYVDATVYTPHSYRGGDPSLSMQNKIVIRAAERMLTRSYDRIFAVAPAEVGYVRGLGVSADKICYIPNGIDGKGFAKTGQARDGVLRVGFLGRLVHQKDPLRFIDILAELSRRAPECEAVVAGDGPYLSAMQQKAAALGVADRISWCGLIPAQTALQQMDVLIHTSLYEAMPYTLLESAAAGIPIVALENDGSRAVLGEHLPGMIVPRLSTAASIAESIIRLCGDEEQLEMVGRGLEKIADTFSLGRMVGCIEREYLALLRASISHDKRYAHS